MTDDWGDSVGFGGDDWGPSWGELKERRKLEEQAAQIDSLRATVDKLPKTADGVSIVLRMTVWTLEDGKAWEWTVAGIGLDIGGDYYLWLDDGEPSRMVSEPGQCYSTREAAEAAKEVQDEDNG